MKHQFLVCIEQSVNYMGIPLPTAADFSAIFLPLALPPHSFPCHISFQFTKEKRKKSKWGGGGHCWVTMQKCNHAFERF